MKNKDKYNMIMQKSCEENNRMKNISRGVELEVNVNLIEINLKEINAQDNVQ